MTEEKNSDAIVLAVGPEDAGERLDIFCAAHVEHLSRSQIKRLNDEGGVEVGGIRRPDRYRLKSGETVRLAPVQQDGPEPVPQDIPLRVVYEDDDLLVINKQAGIVVHPAYGNRDGTVVNALLGRGTRLSGLGGTDRPGIVQRLDKDTSGLMVVAKSDPAYRGLNDQLRAREVHKVYHAVVWGNLGVERQTIDASLGRHPVHRQRMAVLARGGREATTEVFVVDSFEYFDYIRIVTLTGRTHQIRVHLSHISHPVLGDSVYGGRRKKNLPSNAEIRTFINALLKRMKRHALHASLLSFVHPVTGERMDFATSLPEDMRDSLEMLHCAG